MRQARIAAGGRPVRAMPVDEATLLPWDGARALGEDEFIWQPAITGTVYGTLLNFKRRARGPGRQRQCRAVPGASGRTHPLHQARQYTGRPRRAT
ncbi:hypothetical protein ACU4GD_08610 [Cupriavidus basilensis]